MSRRPAPDTHPGAGHAPRPAGLGAAASGPSGPSRATFGFVALMASLGAINAFSIDIVIPAMGRIADGFAVADANDSQWLVLGVMLGMALSQVILGPVADRYGRRPAVFLGMAVALCGGLLAAFAPSFEMLVAGRVLQGLGTGGLRVVAFAITRDRFSGDEMARVVSLTNTVFVLIVFLAPIIGQAIVEVASWRWLFAVIAVEAVATTIWFALVQPETLRPEHRRALSPVAVGRTFLEIVSNPTALGFALAVGAAFGAFATFIASSQMVLGGIYGLDRALPWAFAALSAGFGLISFANSKAVMRWGARPLARAALAVWAVSGLGACALFGLLYDGVPPLWLMMVWMTPTLGLFGLLFGNLLALSLEPMGDKAGSASSVVSAFGTLCGMVLGALMAELFNYTVLPLAGIIGAAGVAGLLALRLGARR